MAAAGPAAGAPGGSAPLAASEVGTGLSPGRVLRAVVRTQAAFRRFLVDEPVRILGIRPTVPAPPVAVALFSCRRLVHPARVNIEEEAMGVAAIICAREHGLTLGPLVATHDYYAQHLPAEHPVLELVRERFSEVLVDAEMDVMKRLQDAELPSEALARLAEARRVWGIPLQALGNGDELLADANFLVQRLRAGAEEVLTSRIEFCKTSAALDALEKEVEHELGNDPTPLRARLRSARLRHRQYVELQAQTVWGWPPVGPLVPLASAARWYTTELGEGHPVVEDFVAAVRRSRLKMEKAAVEELTPQRDALAAVRKQLDADPGPPRLLAEAMEEELTAKLAVTSGLLEEVRLQLGCESASVLQLSRGILGPRVHRLRLEAEAEEAAAILRQPLPPPCPGLGAQEAEMRQEAAVRLLQLLPSLHVDAPQRADSLQVSFAEQLNAAKPLGSLLLASQQDSDEGWHQPPGFRRVEQPEPPPPDPPPLTPPPTPPPAKGPPEPDISVSMRLHGVTMEVAQQNSEILLLERLADLIAKECAVPRAWISHVALSPPAPKVVSEDTADGVEYAATAPAATSDALGGG